MNRLLRLLTLSILLAGLAWPAAAQRAQSDQPVRNRPRAEAALLDVVQGLYTSQFQEQVGVTDEQYIKILPLLRTGIEIMRNNADRSLRSMNQLRQLVRQKASEDQMNAQIREVDEADRQTKLAQQSFIAKIDPFLNGEQKARFRLFQATFEQRLRELVQRARQLNQTAPLQRQQAP